VPEMAEAALQLAPDALALGSFEDMLEQDLDGIVIATPSALHAAQSIAALDRGLAVFCQKPLGRSHAEVEAVVEAARRADRALGLDLSYRHTAGMQQIRALIASGALGPVFSADLMFHNAYGPDKPWFYDPALSGGGCLTDLGSHLVDLMFYLFKSPSIEVRYVNLLSQGKQILSLGERVEDFAEAQLKTSTEISIRMACSWKLPGGKDAEIYFRIYGTAGGASFHNVNGSFYDFQADYFTQNTTETLTTPPDEWGGKAIQRWAKQLVQKNTFDPDNYELIKSAALLEEIYKYTGI